MKVHSSIVLMSTMVMILPATELRADVLAVRREVGVVNCALDGDGLDAFHGRRVDDVDSSGVGRDGHEYVFPIRAGGDAIRAARRRRLADNLSDESTSFRLHN